MKDLVKVMRLAFYVCALPLVATATVSAFQYMETRDNPVDTAAVAAQETSLAMQDKQATYVVRRTSDGVVNGRVVEIDPKTSKVSGIAGLSVQFAQQGNLVAKTTTDEQGNFSVGDMNVGLYSFFGIDENSFVTFAVKVVSNNSENAAYSLFIESVATTGMVDKLTREFVEGKRTNSLTSLTPEYRSEFKNLSGGSRVQLSDDGTLKGRAISLYKEGNDQLEGTLVQIYQNGELVDETKTDSLGYYTFTKLDDGVYDLVAIGKGGFAAFRFDAYRAANDAVIANDGAVPTAVKPVQEAATGLAPVQEFALTPFNDAVFTQDPTVIQEDPPVIVEDSPVFFDAPAFAPGPGTGPTGGFGGRGFWRLLAIPIIIVGDGDGTGPPGPVSPNS